MILDDHEIEDNWSQDRLGDAGKQHLFNVAIGAYQSYQWSHGPRTYGRLLYYAFECAGYPVFVLDTRTQRYKDDQPGLRDNHLLGRPSLDPVNHPGQLQRLLDWLTAQQDRAGNVPKFVVTSSVFVPNAIEERLDPAADAFLAGAAPTPPPDAEAGLYQFNRARRENSDSWPAYPVTRLALLRHIVQGKIQNVVFLAGDVHCSNVAEIEFEGAGDLKAFSVTSSAFYWPFPFADGDPNGYVHDSRADGQRDPFPVLQTSAVMHYRSFGYTQEDNFTRVDLDRAAATLTVRVLDREGNLVTVTDRAATRVTANVLRLAAW
jgi:alkaline phosphatase D